MNVWSCKDKVPTMKNGNIHRLDCQNKYVQKTRHAGWTWGWVKLGQDYIRRVMKMNDPMMLRNNTTLPKFISVEAEKG